MKKFILLILFILGVYLCSVFAFAAGQDTPSVDTGQSASADSGSVSSDSGTSVTGAGEKNSSGSFGSNETVDRNISQSSESSRGNETRQELRNRAEVQLRFNETERINETERNNSSRNESFGNNGLHEGSYVTEEGKHIDINVINETASFRVNDSEARSDLNLSSNETDNHVHLYAHLSNGKNAEIKIMTDTASQTAIANLALKVCSQENNCTIQLKEVGQGNETSPVYEVDAKKDTKVLGLFNARMNVQAQIDATTGNVTGVHKPWWAFMTSG